MIEVKNLVKNYGATRALDGVSFRLETGRILGLVGPNGSGKSTLLKIIAGISSYRDGVVRVMGEKPGKSTRYFTSYIPEIDALYRDMTIGDHVNFVKGFVSDWDSSREKELYELLELHPDQKIKSLSKGFRKRVQILLGLSRKAKVFLLDEPLSGIDPLSRSLILDALLKIFSSYESTVIFSTHIVKEAENMFDEVIFLKKGIVILEGSADELRKKFGKSIEDIFREVYHEHPQVI